MKNPYLGQLVKCPDGYVGKIIEIENKRRVTVEVVNQSAWDVAVLEPWHPSDLTEDTLEIFKSSLMKTGLSLDQAEKALNEVLNDGLLIRERT